MFLKGRRGSKIGIFSRYVICVRSPQKWDVIEIEMKMLWIQAVSYILFLFWGRTFDSDYYGASLRFVDSHYLTRHDHTTFFHLVKFSLRVPPFVAKLSDTGKGTRHWETSAKTKKRSCLKTNRAVTSPACLGVIPRSWLDQPIQGTWLQHSSSAVQCVIFGSGYVVRVFCCFFSP